MMLTHRQPICANYPWMCDSSGIMPQISDQANPVKAGTVPGLAERRRPGRPEAVNPALIPLLRRESLLKDVLAQRDGDDLGAARGIGLSTAIGLVLWIAAAALGWWLFAR